MHQERQSCKRWSQHLLAILGLLIITITVCSLFIVDQEMSRQSHSHTSSRGKRLTDFASKSTQKSSKRLMKINSPVFVLSLPKSGTFSMQSYFNCGLSRMRKRKSAHHWGKKANGKRDKLGNCFRRNQKRKLPLTKACGNYSVWVDAGVPSRDGCWYPGLDGLDSLARHHSNATIVLGTRPAKNWLKSVRGYDSASLIERWTQNCPHFPNVTPDDDADLWMQFYHNYTRRVRKFAKEHPTMTYIEVDLESNRASQLLKEKIGFPNSCFKKCRPGGAGCQSLP